MRTLEPVTKETELKVGDTVVDRNPVTEREIEDTVKRVTKTRVFTAKGSEFDREGCNPHDRLMRWRVRLFKAVEE